MRPFLESELQAALLIAAPSALPDLRLFRRNVSVVEIDGRRNQARNQRTGRPIRILERWTGCRTGAEGARRFHARRSEGVGRILPGVGRHLPHAETVQRGDHQNDGRSVADRDSRFPARFLIPHL